MVESWHNFQDCRNNWRNLLRNQKFQTTNLRSWCTLYGWVYLEVNVLRPHETCIESVPQRWELCFRVHLLQNTRVQHFWTVFEKQNPRTLIGARSPWAEQLLDRSCQKSACHSSLFDLRPTRNWQNSNFNHACISPSKDEVMKSTRLCSFKHRRWLAHRKDKWYRLESRPHVCSF